MKSSGKRVSRAQQLMLSKKRSRQFYERKINDLQHAIETYISSLEVYRANLTQTIEAEKEGIKTYSGELKNFRTRMKQKPRSSDAYVSFKSHHFEKLGRFKSAKDFRYANGEQPCCVHESWRTCRSTGMNGRFHDIMRTGDFFVYRLNKPTFKCGLYEKRMRSIFRSCSLNKDVSTIILEFAPIAYADEILLVRGRCYRSQPYEMITFLPIRVYSFAKFQQGLDAFEISLVSEAAPHSWALRAVSPTRFLHRCDSKTKSGDGVQFFPRSRGGYMHPGFLRTWRQGAAFRLFFYVSGARLGL